MARRRQPHERDESLVKEDEVLSSAAVSSIVQTAGHYVTRTIAEGGLVRRPKEAVRGLLHPASSRTPLYSPLPSSSHIRVLNVLPGSPSSVLQCKLTVVNLEDAPTFTAMSYTWGKDVSWSGTIWGYMSQFFKQNSPRATSLVDTYLHATEGSRTIICNGKTVTVLPNLYDALLQLRQVKTQEPHWIDAICINQEDIPEREAQVRMMDRIYQAAASVTIWLGDCPQILSAAVEQLEKSSGKVPTVKDLGSLSSAFKSWAGGDAADAAVVSAAVYILQRRYFRRMWVLQEMHFARELNVFIGEHRLSLSTLVSLAKWAYQDPIEVEGRTPKADFRPTMRYAVLFMGGSIAILPTLLSPDQTFLQGQLSLREWFELTKGRKATDPRDYIYSGLSLIKSDELTIDQTLMPDSAAEKLWPRIRVDYKASPAEVQLQVSVCVASQQGVGDLLTLAARHRQRDDDHKAFPSNMDPDGQLARLPSWQIFPGAEGKRKLHSLSSLGARPLNACSMWPPGKPEISSNGKELRVEAFNLGSITSVSPELNLSKKGGEIMDFLAFLDTLPAGPSPSDTSSLKTLAEAFFCGTWDEGDGDVGQALVTYVGHKVHTSSAASASSSQRRNKLTRLYESIISKHPHYIWPRKPQDVVTEKAHLFEQESEKFRIGRSLFTTTKGHIGLGPQWLKKQDQVGIIRGTAVPFAFRQIIRDLGVRITLLKKDIDKAEKDGKAAETMVKLRERLADVEKERAVARAEKRNAWTLLGEAYVWGVMDGQAVHEGTFQDLCIV